MDDTHCTQVEPFGCHRRWPGRKPNGGRVRHFGQPGPHRGPITLARTPQAIDVRTGKKRAVLRWLSDIMQKRKPPAPPGGGASSTPWGAEFRGDPAARYAPAARLAPTLAFACGRPRCRGSGSTGQPGPDPRQTTWPPNQPSPYQSRKGRGRAPSPRENRCRGKMGAGPVAAKGTSWAAASRSTETGDLHRGDIWRRKQAQAPRIRADFLGTRPSNSILRKPGHRGGGRDRVRRGPPPTNV